MLETSSTRAVALATAVSLVSCSGPGAPTESGDIGKELRTNTRQFEDPNRLAGEQAWSVGEELSNPNRQTSTLSLAMQAVRDGIFPTASEHGTQWYQVPAQGGGAYFARAEINRGEPGPGADEVLRVTIIPIAEQSNACFISEMSFNQWGQILNAPIGETATHPDGNGARIVRTSADNLSLLSKLNALVVASAGTENAHTVPPDRLPELEQLFSSRTEALHQMLK